MKNLKYKLYKSRKNKRLHKDLRGAAQIYNHCIALHKCYYRIFKKHLSLYKLQKHLTKLKQLEKYAHFKKINSQVIQEITERIEKGYQLFFLGLKGKSSKISPPGFKKSSKYRSMTFKQSGFKYLGTNKIKIRKHIYKFSLSRPVDGCIKTMTLKRDALGDFYLCFSVELEEEQIKTASDKIVGFDFGLQTFLKSTDNKDIESPKFLEKEMCEIKPLSKRLSKKKKGSNNRRRARKALARKYKDIANKRHDWFFKTAHHLCKNYRLISLEGLDIKSMAKRFGKKISDYAFSEFVSILQYIAKKYTTIIHICDQYYASSKLCSLCDNYNGLLKLSQRSWHCKNCCAHLDRDKNASYNILRAGASAHGLGDIRPSLEAVSVRIQESHLL